MYTIVSEIKLEIRKSPSDPTLHMNYDPEVGQDTFLYLLTEKIE